jgi:hypothetical protein
LTPGRSRPSSASARPSGRSSAATPALTDPVFFDPKANESRPLDEEWLVAAVAAAMEKAGIDPAKIHAYRRTGMLVTPQNLDQWSANDLVEWEAALDEYDMLAARRNCMSQGVLVPVRHRVYLLASHSTATRMRQPPTHLPLRGGTHHGTLLRPRGRRGSQSRWRGSSRSVTF